MSTPTLVTKLYIPPPRPGTIARPHLIERLNEGLRSRLILVSAPAGFGKTTVVSEWLSGRAQPAAWVSLDERDGDLPRFLRYLIAALQTVNPGFGAGMGRALELPQPPAATFILTALLNDISTLRDDLVIVLDDYHLVDSPQVDEAIGFLIEHLPSCVHIVIITREDLQLPLARLRARGEMTELRAADLRFTFGESAAFLNETMGLALSAANIAALEERTEGWIAGLQMAAISMQGRGDASSFIESFTGNHRFVIDYLMEEVLQQRSDEIQTFLLRTSVLDRLCGALCDAVLLATPGSGQATLEYLERTNLFLVPLDDERRWYRYHHLFAELLRQRLQQQSLLTPDDLAADIPALHRRASVWYERNGMVIEAFRHAAAANDVERAGTLIESENMPRHFRGAVTVILDWLGSLPVSVLNERPSLWWRYASLQLVVGQTTGVEEKLQAAEEALNDAPIDTGTRDLIGRIANARAVLALTRYQPDVIVTQAQRALEYLASNNVSSRASVQWTLGFASLLTGDRAAASRAYTESISLSNTSGDVFTTILATGGLAQAQEADTRLRQAAETYRRALDLAGNQPLPILSGAHLGLARISYEWNDLDAAEHYGQQSLDLARQFEHIIDRFVVSEVFLARLKLARNDIDGAAVMLNEALRTARQRAFLHQIPDIEAVRVLVLIRQGQLDAGDHLAHEHDLPLSRARVLLAKDDPSAALDILQPLRQRAENRDWKDELLKVMVLQAIATQALGEREAAVQLLEDALIRAEADGFVRLFIDEGAPMTRLLTQAAARGIAPSYAVALLEASGAGEQAMRHPEGNTPLAEPLSPRELEVLRLIAQGLSNREIGERLFLALDTVKGHNRKVFGKLGAQSRTEAVARAHDLGLLRR